MGLYVVSDTEVEVSGGYHMGREGGETQPYPPREKTQDTVTNVRTPTADI